MKSKTENYAINFTQENNHWRNELKIFWQYCVLRNSGTQWNKKNMGVIQLKKYICLNPLISPCLKILNSSVSFQITDIPYTQRNKKNMSVHIS